MSSPYPVSNDHTAVYVNQTELGYVAFPVINRDATLANQKDYVLWSFFNTMFCNVFCLGFMALVYSIKARDRKVANDMSGAAQFASTAKCFNIAVAIFVAIGVGITIFSLIIIFVSAPR